MSSLYFFYLFKNIPRCSRWNKYNIFIWQVICSLFHIFMNCVYFFQKCRKLSLAKNPLFNIKRWKQVRRIFLLGIIISYITSYEVKKIIQNNKELRITIPWYRHLNCIQKNIQCMRNNLLDLHFSEKARLGTESRFWDYFSGAIPSLCAIIPFISWDRFWAC